MELKESAGSDEGNKQENYGQYELFEGVNRIIMTGLKSIVAGMDTSGKLTTDEVLILILISELLVYNFSDREAIVGWCIGKVSMLYLPYLCTQYSSLLYLSHNNCLAT